MTSGLKKPISRRWRRRALWACGGGLLLLVLAWLILTSGMFIRSVVLPRVSEAIHADLTAESVKLGLFSGLRATGVRLTPNGGDTFVTADELIIQHDLGGVLGGALAVKRARAVNPEVTIVGSGPTSNNLSDWLQSFKTKEADDSGDRDASESGGVLAFDLNQIEIVNGRISYEIRDATGQIRQVKLENLRIDLDRLRNSATSGLQLATTVGVSQSATGTNEAHSVNAGITLDAAVGLNADLMPEQFSVEGTLRDVEGIGRFASAVGLAAELDVQGDNARFRRAELTFRNGDTTVGHLLADGQFDLKTLSGELGLTIEQLPPAVFELASVVIGVDFSVESLTSTNQLAVAANAAGLETRGAIHVDGLSVTLAGGALPATSLNLEHALAIDFQAQHATLTTLNGSLESGSGSMSTAVLAPIEVTWTDAFESTTGSQLQFAVTNAVVSDWLSPFVKSPVEGEMNLEFTLHSRDQGGDIRLVGNGSLDRGSIVRSTNVIDQLHARLAVDARLERFDALHFETFSLTAGKGEAAPLTATLEGDVGLSATEGTVGTSIELPVAQLGQFIAGVPATFGDAVLRFDGDVVLNGPENISLNGSFGSSPVGFSAGSRTLDAVALTLPISLQFVGTQLKWAVSGARMGDDTGDLIRIDSDGSISVANGVGELSARVAGLNAALINSFATNYLAGATLDSGDVSVSLNGRLLEDGMQRWSMDLMSTNVVLQSATNRTGSRSLASAASLRLETHPGERRFELETLTGTVYADGTAAGNLSAEGRVSLENLEAALDVTLTNVNEQALQPLASLFIGGRDLEEMNLNAMLQFRHLENEPSGLQMDVALSDLRISDPDNPMLSSLHEARLRLDAAITDQRIEIREGKLDLTPTTNAPNSMTLDGWLDVADRGLMRGELELHSDGLDLTASYDLLVGNSEATTNQVESSSTETSGLTEIKAGESTFRLPFEDLKIAVDIDEVYLRALKVTNWLVQAELQTNAVQLELFSLSLNGAPVNANGHFRSIEGSFDYAFAAEVEKLGLDPLLHTFHPEYADVATAEVYAAVDLEGEMLPGADLWPTAAGHMYLGVTNGHAQLMPRNWQTLLSPVALMLQTPELFSSPLKWFYSHTELGDQTLKLHQYTVMADAYIADASAVIPLNLELKSTPVPQVPVHLFLSRNLLTRLKLLNKATGDTNVSYVALPDFVYLTGTFGEPKVDINKMRTSGMVLGKAGDFVGGTASGILQGAGNITTGVGEVLSGRSSDGTDGDTGPVREGVNFVFKSLGGLIGGSGNVLESGTGVVTGTDVVEGAGMAERFRSFDWPRQFGDAPNRLPE